MQLGDPLRQSLAKPGLQQALFAVPIQLIYKLPDALPAGGRCPRPTVPAGEDGRDPSTWTPVRIAGEQPAPEFEDITAWLNSKPLTTAGLKGKVVVVHFMAFG